MCGVSSRTCWHPSVFRKMSMQEFGVFFAGFVFLVLRHMNSLYILDISPLSDTSFANTFPHTVSCLFILSMVPYARQVV